MLFVTLDKAIFCELVGNGLNLEHYEVFEVFHLFESDLVVNLALRVLSRNDVLSQQGFLHIFLEIKNLFVLLVHETETEVVFTLHLNN